MPPNLSDTLQHTYRLSITNLSLSIVESNPKPEIYDLKLIILKFQKQNGILFSNLRQITSSPFTKRSWILHPTGECGDLLSG